MIVLLIFENSFIWGKFSTGKLAVKFSNKKRKDNFDKYFFKNIDEVKEKYLSTSRFIKEEKIICDGCEDMIVSFDLIKK